VQKQVESRKDSKPRKKDDAMISEEPRAISFNLLPVG
jgi:hypothetical protein